MPGSQRALGTGHFAKQLALGRELLVEWTEPSASPAPIPGPVPRMCGDEPVRPCRPDHPPLRPVVPGLPFSTPHPPPSRLNRYLLSPFRELLAKVAADGHRIFLPFGAERKRR